MTPRVRAGRVRIFRPIFVFLGTVVALACVHPLAPGDLLVGTWSSADATLSAEPTGTTLTIPCIAVRLAPIRLEDSLTFYAGGVVTRSGALRRVGDPFPLVGRVVGNRVVIPVPFDHRHVRAGHARARRRGHPCLQCLRPVASEAGEGARATERREASAGGAVLTCRLIGCPP